MTWTFSLSGALEDMLIEARGKRSRASMYLHACQGKLHEAMDYGEPSAAVEEEIMFAVTMLYSAQRSIDSADEAIETALLELASLRKAAWDFEI